MAKRKTTARYPLAVRILALVMTVLIASGAVVYFIMLLMGLFGL